jgi:hypothetical protein
VRPQYPLLALSRHIHITRPNVRFRGQIPKADICASRQRVNIIEDFTLARQFEYG